jgi:beta-N-acetylhexosaminidase
VPVLAVTVVAGVAGFLVTTPSPEVADAPGVMIPADGGDLTDVDVCTRASLEDRAGRVLVVGLPGVTESDHPLVDPLAEVGVGGVMLRDENLLDEDQARDLIDGLRTRLGDHLLVAIDDEGGRVAALDALDEPLRSARTLARLGRDTTFEHGRELGELASSIGVDWVLAPVADLDGGPAGGVIGDRSFGTDPDEVAELAGAFADGLREGGVAVAVKHFPGHGGDGDPHLGGARDTSTLAELESADLRPFEALIDDGAEAVMVNHVAYESIWGDEPASLVPDAYALLRELGFEGVAVTDAIGMGAVHARYGFDTAPAMAIGAGADAVLVTQGYAIDELHKGLVDAVRDGRLNEARLDEAVGRVLALAGEPTDGIVCDP